MPRLRVCSVVAVACLLGCPREPSGDDEVGEEDSSTSSSSSEDESSEDESSSSSESSETEASETEETETGETETGDESEGVLPPAEPAQLALEISAIKQFQLAWQPVPDADFYRLFERVQPAADYQQLGEELDAGPVTLRVPLHLRASASYKLASCNAGGCVDSDPIDVTGNLAEAVGFVKASNTQSEDYFGHTVALSADGLTLAVGAVWEDSTATGIDGDQHADQGFEYNAGAVYVFALEDGVWSQQAYIKASNTGPDAFGDGLALSADGNTLAVGALREDSGATGIGGNQLDNGASDSGAVYVFVREDGEWSQQAYVKASNPGSSDRFGRPLALSASGDVLAVGSPWEDSSATGIDGNQASNAALDSGAVYVFARSGGVWAQQAYVKASNTGAGDLFGLALALSSSGERLAVGAWQEDGAAIGIDGDQASNASPNAGAVYVFDHDGNGWSQQAYVKASNAEAEDYFGVAVELADEGNLLVASALLEDSSATGVGGDQANDAALDSGAAYVFELGQDGWTQVAYLKPANPHEDARFGNALALSSDGTLLAIAAFQENNLALGVDDPLGIAGAFQSGAAYVFEAQAGVWTPRAYVKASNAEPFDTFGQDLALSGDGRLLVISAQAEESTSTGIGGDQQNNGAFGAGAVYLY